jgi:EAL domain-containing protein (putative c-di-GMP-specific phosphodiesterase class I)
VNLRREIKHAIANQEFKLYYQPIINLETNEIAGQEALIRWHHPVDIMRSPCDFIPQCEADPSTMIEICEFVVKQSWRDRDKLEGDFISVNVSPKSLEQKRFWDTLEECSLIGDRPVLFLEITERSLTNYKIIAPHFVKSGERAIGAFIDDFGVEYSGFIQVAKVLNLFPSTEYVKVKLDIEFARNLGDPTYRWFAKSIITSMRDCPSGKIDVIAEGIEHEWQRDLFREYGVKYGQGWLWGKAAAIA